MHTIHQLLSEKPVDFHQLSLFLLLVKHRHFTKAAAEAGLTQSAMTRSISGLERLLEIRLFERTTRKVEITPAGKFLEQEAKRLLGDLDRSLQKMKEAYAGQKPKLRIAISETVSHAHLYGLLPGASKVRSQVRYVIMSVLDQHICPALESNECDVGVLSLPDQLPAHMTLRHAFQDRFTIIAPTEMWQDMGKLDSESKIRQCLSGLPWLSIPEGTYTGDAIQKWMKQNRLKIDPTMEINDFDRIIHLVMLGTGVSIVPIRALAPYRHKRKICRIPLGNPFTRKVGVITHRRAELSTVTLDFIHSILFRESPSD